MSKAILVLDEMPENCNQCKFFDIDMQNGRMTAACVAMSRIWIKERDGDKPDWCPLQYILGPVKINDEDGADEGLYWFLQGFNFYANKLSGNE